MREAKTKNKAAKIIAKISIWVSIENLTKYAAAQSIKDSHSQFQLGLKVQVYKLNWGSIRAGSSSSSIRASEFQLGLQLGFVWVSNFS